MNRNDTCRYAVYYSPPPESAFERLGAAALGRDARTGETAGILPVDGIANEALDALTETPRRYGFHGTLKAPFRLSEGTTENALLGAVAAIARELPAFHVAEITIGILDGFVALMPASPSVPLNDLAARCVVDLDPFRAPLTAAEIARRNPDALTPRQRGYLNAYGYPYVLDAFRFHMTLSSRTDEATAEAIAAARRTDFEAILDQGLTFDGLSIFRQASVSEPFRLLNRYLFGITA